MAGGQRLEHQIRVGMAAAGIRGMAELARRSGVGRDTLYAWFRGDQEPKPDTLARIAEVLGVPLPSLWTYTPDAQGNPLQGEAVATALFGVALVPALDSYRYVERAIKYGILFLALVFTAFFLFEVRLLTRVHPFQYTLVGAALCLFYLAILSLSEFIPFGWAYLAGSVAATTLIGFYSAWVLGGARRAWLVAAGLAAIYAFLYVLLRQQEYSLLYGTGALFLALGVVMYATRRLDWYARDGA